MPAIFQRMDLDGQFDEVEQEFVTQLRRVVDREIAPRAETIDRDASFPWDNVRALNELGINGVFIPREYGGTPTSYRCILRLVEELSRGCAATANTWTNTYLTAHAITSFGTSEQMARILPRINTGGLAAVAFAESAGVADDVSSSTTLTPHPKGGWLLRGEKRFITNGDVAEVIVAFANIPEPVGDRKHLTAVILERDTPGLVIGPAETKLGYRASSTVSLFFDDCALTTADILGVEGAGYPILRRIHAKSRPCLSAQAIGIAGAAFDEAVRSTNDRQIFGQRVLDFQGVQFMFADMISKLALARSWMLYVGRLIDEYPAENHELEGSILKIAASDAAMSITTDAVQVNGGAGYMAGATVERLYRDAKLTQMLEDANEWDRARIGSSFLNAP